MEIETWYISEDGTALDPREVAPGKDGMLVHKDGRKVAYAPHGPRSRSVDPRKEARNTKPDKLTEAVTPESKAALLPETKDMKPADENRSYATREITGRKSPFHKGDTDG
jgi:hypothetical protein